MIEYYKQIIENYIKENIDHCNSYSFEIFSKSIDNFFCDINIKSTQEIMYVKKYSLEEIFELANNFFNELGIIEIINSTPIDFYFVDISNIELVKEYNKNGIYVTTSKLGKDGTKVVLFLEGKLSDLYELVHETIHAIACDYKGMKENDLIEILPVLSELYLTDYLEKESIDESKINQKIRKYNIEKHLPNSSWEKIYLDEVLQNGKINNFYHADEILVSFANELNNRNGLFIRKTEIYLFAMMFGSYIHQNFDSTQFLKLISSLKNMDFKEFLSFIEIGDQNELIDSKGYQKIFKSYKKDYLNE